MGPWNESLKNYPPPLHSPGCCLCQHNPYGGQSPQAQGEHSASSSQAASSSYMFSPCFPHGKPKELWRRLCIKETEYMNKFIPTALLTRGQSTHCRTGSWHGKCCARLSFEQGMAIHIKAAPWPTAKSLACLSDGARDPQPPHVELPTPFSALSTLTAKAAGGSSRHLSCPKVKHQGSQHLCFHWRGANDTQKKSPQNQELLLQPSEQCRICLFTQALLVALCGSSASEPSPTPAPEHSWGREAATGSKGRKHTFQM